jgi:hypothetical protein
MKTKEAFFACLNCGADTGCANKLVCDKCRVKRRRAQAGEPRAKAKRPTLTGASK